MPAAAGCPTSPAPPPGRAPASVRWRSRAPRRPGAPRATGRLSRRSGRAARRSGTPRGSTDRRRRASATQPTR
eukprot:scaffold36127_cov90-Isochrysis_galbana.AAC.3